MLLAETSELPGTAGASELLELAAASEIPELAEISASPETAEVSASPELAEVSASPELAVLQTLVGNRSSHALPSHKHDSAPHKTLSDGPYDHTAHKSCCSCAKYAPLDHNHGTLLAHEAVLVLVVSATDRKVGTLASLNCLLHLVLGSSVHPSWLQ